MDKIFLKDWMTNCSQTETNVLCKTERYTEIVTSLEEPGLLVSQSQMIRVPGMTGTLHRLIPQRELYLCETIENEHIQSAFILSGTADSNFNNKPVLTQCNSHAFQYSSNLLATHRLKGGQLEAFHISFDVEYFRKLIQAAATPELEKISVTLEKKEQFLIPPSLLPLQVRMNEIINDIRNCSFHAVTRALYMEAKMLELFALQIEQMSGVDQQKKEILNKTDREKLLALKEYIETNYLQNLSLKQLGGAFGLNEFKLKKGYKLMFKTTVFGHIYSLRMQKAMQLLSEKNMTVSEIADRVGYANIGSFSAEFKKRFGYPPSKVHS